MSLMTSPPFTIDPAFARFALFDDARTRLAIAQEIQQVEAFLLDSILQRLCDRGRILPSEELYREPWKNGGMVVWTMPEGRP